MGSKGLKRSLVKLEMLNQLMKGCWEEKSIRWKMWRHRLSSRFNSLVMNSLVLLMKK